MTTPFQPVNFDSEPLSQDKLKKLASNQNMIFSSMPKVRYSYGGAPRETQVKIIAGKTPFPIQTTRNYGYLNINFGTFFTAGCKPIVTATLEVIGGSMHRAKVVIQNRGTAEIDHNGFTAIVSGDSYKTLATTSWVNWIAIGY